MKKTAIYCRVSTNTQSNGLESQILSCKSYCEQNGISEYEVFQDEGISGAKTSRPGLDEMMKAVREGKISAVVTFSFSRFGRSTIHLITALEEFNKLGVQFVSVSERLDTQSPIGKVIFQILSSLAEFEREQIASRVKNGLVNARAKGKRLGAPRKPINRELLLRLKNQGLSLSEIGRLMGCSSATICRALKIISKEAA